MSLDREVVLHVDVTGRLSFLFDDRARELLSLGLSTINRASHVEPHIDPLNRACQWTADLAPIGGPVLGPFDSRAEALAAEIAEVERRLARS